MYTISELVKSYVDDTKDELFNAGVNKDTIEDITNRMEHLGHELREMCAHYKATMVAWAMSIGAIEKVDVLKDPKAAYDQIEHEVTGDIFKVLDLPSYVYVVTALLNVDTAPEIADAEAMADEEDNDVQEGESP